jgi:predicted outer membrane repeat protein
LRVQDLESRVVPANFNIANGDNAALIAAINACNTNNQPDTITLAIGGTYTFTAPAEANEGGSALPSILRDSADANTVTILGRGSLLTRSTAVGTPEFRLLRIGNFPNIVRVTLNDVFFSNGRTSIEFGGAVKLAAGDLTVNDCGFTSNQARFGGAIYATNTTIKPRNLSITGNFENNQATGAPGSGGAVYSIGSTDVNVVGGAFMNNTSTAEGGALRVQTSNGMTAISGVLFSNNTANGGNGGGAIFVQGNTRITECTIRDNTSNVGGGGVWVQLGAGGLFTMTGSTVSGNRANSPVASGGGLFIQGDATIVNSTIHNNRAGSGGGIAFANGTQAASITHSTITDNRAFFALATGGGISINSGVVSLGHSIVADNTLESGGTGPDVGGTINSTGYNLIESLAGAAIIGTTIGNINNTSPNLGALQLNGGPTPTRLPNAGSPVIDAGDPAFLPPPHTDQRGTGYARVWGDRLDIGAVERVAPPRISATQVNDGAGQRSRVMKLTVTFDRIVNFVTTVAEAFQIQRNSDNAMVTFTATENVVGGVTVVTLTAFAGSAAQSGSLADGRYTLTAFADQIVADGQMLDGNGDGQPGDNYTFGDAQGLFRMFGDWNGDRQVDGFDFGAFSSTFNLTAQQAGFLAAFDINGDGAVDGFDFSHFSGRYNTVLP